MNESASNGTAVTHAPPLAEPASSGDLRRLIEPVEQLVARHPAVCLASAFALGAALAWWIKRK